MPALQHGVAAALPDVELLRLLEGAEARPGDLWRQVVDTLGEGLLVLGPDRRVAFLNRRAEVLLGRTQAEARGALCTEAMRCPACQCRCRLFDEGGADGVEVTVYSHPDAHPRVLRKNSRLLRDAEGRVLGGVETFVDVTREVAERREAERYAAMLFQAKTRADALLDAMDDGVLSVDAEQRVLSCSAKLARLLGLPGVEAALGRSLEALLGVAPGFFGARTAAELDGRRYPLELAHDGARQPATLWFRRVRLSDDEMLGVLRLADAPAPRARTVREGERFHGIVSRSPRMWELFRLVESAAQGRASVLVEGESGVGKELVARAIHRLSLRSAEPFYGVNCATFTGSLLRSELFGHERGAFTGAVRTTPGKLELAGDGTLFLDEVSEIPLQDQAVLLRVLEERCFERVGGHKRMDLRARVVAATNRRLTEAVQRGEFRQDLYFRLRVIPIQVPPLRERPEDVPLLVAHFAALPAVNPAGRTPHFTAAALEALTRHRWPGNVRELRNVVEYLCLLPRDTVDVADLPEELRGGATAAQHGTPCDPPPDAGAAPDTPLRHERASLLAALEHTHYRRAEAAQLLGIDRTTLWRRMKRLGVR